MKNILLILLVLITYHSNSQHLVDSFNMPTPKTFASIDEIKVTPDNKILLAGDIDFHNGTEVQSVIKLNLDGSLDSNFEFTHEKSIKKIEFLSTGEIIALDRDSLYKINEFGTIISSINLGVSTFYSDFKIKNDYIFLAANGLGLKKYDSNFTLVTGFNNDNLFENGVVRTLAFQNEKILVAGTFSSVNGFLKNDIARFDSNGNLDETFDTGLGTSDPLTAMVVQDDNKIILSESFINNFNGISCNGLARLNENGSVDLEFSPPIINSHVGSNVIVHNDQILVTEYYYVGEDSYVRLVKLNLDGALNSSFDLNDLSFKIALHPDGDILIDTDVLKKYSIDGTIDSDFNPILERIGYFNNAAYYDDFIIVTGDFHSLNGVATDQIGKIDLEGNVDSNFIFTNETTIRTLPKEVKVKQENEIFVSFGNKLLKLDNLGNRATDFNTPEEVIEPSGKTDSYFAEKFEFLSNGKIVMAGPNGLYILNEDGSQDTSFDFENTSNINSTAFAFGLQSTEKIVYGSSFTEVNNIEVNRLARLNIDGSLDFSFDIGEGPSSSINYITITSNDEVIVGTYGFNGFSSNLGIFKLGTDGLLDEEYIENLNSSFNEQFYFINGQNFKNNSLLFSGVNSLTNELFIGKLSEEGSLETDFVIDHDISISRYNANPIPISDNLFLLLGDLTLNATNTRTKGLLFIDNDIPEITAATHLSTLEETPLAISLDDITVVDTDNNFPIDFTISTLEGNNYTVSNNQIIPVENFNGTLSIPITVNDGLDDSEPYLLSVDVTAINDIPEITAAVSLSTPEETPLLILIENITVVDPDNDFPGDFTLSVSEGDNYTVSNNEIIPVENFNGTLSVPIIVNDGLDYSEPYLLSVDVTAINDIPEIISTESSFSTNQETSLLISIEDFTVEDPDNDFPGDFILTVMPGNNYTITGNQVLPAKDFSGLLSVFVTVNDGIDESSPYKIEVDVMAILSVKEASSQFLIYPNPAESHITLNNIGQERYNQLLIYDAMGTLIIQKNNLKEDNLTINISSIPEGMYILILKKDEHSVTRKFIKI